MIEELIKATILGEQHLGENLKRLCIGYINNLQKENQKYKEVIDKAIEKLEEVKERRIMLLDEKKVLNILKGVE